MISQSGPLSQSTTLNIKCNNNNRDRDKDSGTYTPIDNSDSSNSELFDSNNPNNNNNIDPVKTVAATDHHPKTVDDDDDDEDDGTQIAHPHTRRVSFHDHDIYHLYEKDQYSNPLFIFLRDKLRFWRQNSARNRNNTNSSSSSSPTSTTTTTPAFTAISDSDIFVESSNNS